MSFSFHSVSLGFVLSNLTSPPLSNEERRGKVYFQSNSIQLDRLMPKRIPIIRIVYALIITKPPFLSCTFALRCNSSRTLHALGQRIGRRMSQSGCRWRSKSSLGLHHSLSKELIQPDMMLSWFSCRVARQPSPLHSSKQNGLSIHDDHSEWPFLLFLLSFRIVRSYYVCPFVWFFLYPAYRPDRNAPCRMRSGSARLSYSSLCYPIQFDPLNARASCLGMKPQKARVRNRL